MAFENSVNTILQTRKNYVPLDDRGLQRAIRDDKIGRAQALKEEAARKAAALKTAADLSTAGLPSRFAQAAQAEINNIDKWVEDGGDPTSFEFQKMVRNAKNTIGTMKQEFDDSKLNGTTEFLKNRENYVVISRDPETGLITNDAEAVSEAINQGFSGEYKEGDDVIADASLIKKSLAGARKIDRNLPTTIRTDIAKMLPILLKKEGIIEDIPEDEYRNLFTTEKYLTETQKDEFRGAIIAEKGEDIAALLISQNPEGITQDELVEYVDNVLMTEYGSDVSQVRDEKQFFEDRKTMAYINNALAIVTGKH